MILGNRYQVSKQAAERSKQAAWLSSSQPNMPRMVYHSMAFSSGSLIVVGCRGSKFINPLNFGVMVKLTKDELLTKSVEVLVDMVLGLDEELELKEEQLNSKIDALDKETSNSKMYWNWWNEERVKREKAEKKIAALKGLLAAWE